MVKQPGVNPIVQNRSNLSAPVHSDRADKRIGSLAHIFYENASYPKFMLMKMTNTKSKRVGTGACWTIDIV